MRSPRLAAAVILLLSAGALAGCAADADAPDSAEMQAWSDGVADAVDGEAGVLGVMAAATGTDGGGQVTLNFEAPVEVSGVDLSCFGEGTATLSVTVSSDDGAIVLGENLVECAAGTMTVDLSGHGRTATKVQVEGVGADRAGYWAAVARGTAPAA